MKFNVGDRVEFMNPVRKLIGRYGTIIGIDYEEPLFYRIKLDCPIGKIKIYWAQEILFRLEKQLDARRKVGKNEI